MRCYDVDMPQPTTLEAVIEPCMTWQESIWFSDVDDTLIDTAGTSTTASNGIRTVFEPTFGAEKASEVQGRFNDLFALMMASYRVKNDEDWTRVPGGQEALHELISYFESSQKQVTAEYGHYKKWSREVFIKCAADDAGISVTPELVHEAADAYWLTLTEQTEVFSDALRLSSVIAEHQRPLFLVTSSDARLKMQSDGQFIYDPAYSEALKRQRIELLRDKGLRFNAMSIGDPEDKPHLDFFNKALRVAGEELGIDIEPSHAIMLGDSFGGDLQTPKERLGFGLVVLREKTKTTTEVNDSHQLSLGDLREVEKFFS